MTGRKQYKYTLYKQDGTIEIVGISPKKHIRDFYTILSCSMIEHIPHDYYPEKSGRAEFWGDEEARFKETNYRNPHFKVLKNPALFGEQEWDVVGDILKEEVYHG